MAANSKRWNPSIAVLALMLAQTGTPAVEPGPIWKLPEGARTLKDIEYASVAGRSLTLDLYLPPAQADAAKPRLFVWIHGGGWREGNKSDCPLLGLVGDGYAVASIGYRLSNIATFPAQIHDCKGAVRWLRAHADKYGYEARTVAAGGASAGGHLVALLGTTGGVKELEGDTGGNTDRSSRVQAVVDLFGPTDFPRLEEQHHIEAVTSVTAFLLGEPISNDRKRAEMASPLYHVTGDSAPILILHGDRDPLVFLPQSRALDEAYRKAGAESTLEIIPGAVHGGGQFVDDRRSAMIRTFLARHVH